MKENFEQSFEQAAAFQKMWMESISKMQAAFSTPTVAPPSEFLQQMRSGVFRALGESWEQFMRSPQFLNAMQQWMEQAVNFRKLSNDFFGKIHDMTPSVSENDINDCLLTLRHAEKRMFDRINELASQLRELSEQVSAIQKNGAVKKQGAKRKRAGALVVRSASPKKAKGDRKRPKKTLLRAARRRDQLNNHPTQGRII